MTDKQLVIDCQILQTPAFDRGMGKYTLSLLIEFLKQNQESKQYNKIEIILSKNLIIDKERLTLIKTRLNGASISLLDLPTNIAEGTESKYSQAKKVITQHVSKKAEGQVDFLMMAPFFVGFPSVFPDIDAVRKFTVVYDLIPQKIWFLQKIFPDDLYFRHFDLFIEADGILTISNAVRDDLLALGLPEDRLASIDGAPFNRALKPSYKSLSNYSKPYILMPSAPIVHKNNKRTVQAFALFNKRNSGKYRLYITSSFDDKTKADLGGIADNVYFTGNISDEELASAYHEASAVLFPSLSEGLGMPVLEASLYDVPVACSDIPVLTELSKKGFYQFDPTNKLAIANSIDDAVNKKNWSTHRDACRRTTKKYTWDRSAKLLAHKLNRPVANTLSPLLPLHIIMPQPNGGTPAGQLGEQLYMLLQKKSSVSVEFNKKHKTSTPSYVAHLMETDSKIRNTLELIDRVSILKRGTRSLKLVYKTEDGTSATICLRAQIKVKEKGLGIKSWTFKNNKGRVLSLQDISELIEGKDRK